MVNADGIKIIVQLGAADIGLYILSNRYKKIVMKTTSFKSLLFFIMLLLLMLGACKPAPQQLTNEEAIQFAKDLEQSIQKGEADLLDNAFDKDTFIDKMNLPNTADGKGFGKGVVNKLKLGTQITTALSDMDNFDFIRHYVKEGKHHLIFRVFTNKESALNYHDYELMKISDKCKIADVYVYMSGETLAETMANMFKSLFGTSNDPSQKNLEGADDVVAVRKLMQRRNFADAKKKIDVLPDYIKATKSLMLLNVLICSELSNEEYSEAINSFKQKFPNEPNMNLMMIDGYCLQKDYTSMLAAINALDAQIDKDPLLDYYRYLSYNLLKKEDSARIYLTQLVKNKPDFQKGILELITVDLNEKNKTESDSLINIYRHKPKFRQKELDDLLAYY